MSIYVKKLIQLFFLRKKEKLIILKNNHFLRRPRQALAINPYISSTLELSVYFLAIASFPKNEEKVQLGLVLAQHIYIHIHIYTHIHIHDNW